MLLRLTRKFRMTTTKTALRSNITDVECRTAML